ncbi:hypothetical protein LJC40_04825 [Synergistaceae bacterium OttesenSCG-928-D05]|nr:hypothetical protein [Synergistaceae bacterium OttesenSCG-928-D05]
MSLQDEASLVVDVIKAAGGRLVGKTRLQKTIYLLQVAGWEAGFNYRYYHYGPYSEDLSDATNHGVYLGIVNEKEETTTWGGAYSIYSTTDKTPKTKMSAPLTKLIETAAKANSVVLELAATALYLHEEEGIKDPWAETEIRKSTKAQEHLNEAKALYQDLRQAAPTLPNLA